MDNDEMVCYDMHIRYTDENGTQRAVQHRVWDGERFFAARLAEAQQQRKTHGHGKVNVEMITAEQYRKERA